MIALEDDQELSPEEVPVAGPSTSPSKPTRRYHITPPPPPDDTDASDEPVESPPPPPKRKTAKKTKGKNRQRSKGKGIADQASGSGSEEDAHRMDVDDDAEYAIPPHAFSPPGPDDEMEVDQDEAQGLGADTFIQGAEALVEDQDVQPENEHGGEAGKVNPDDEADDEDDNQRRPEARRGKDASDSEDDSDEDSDNNGAQPLQQKSSTRRVKRRPSIPLPETPRASRNMLYQPGMESRNPQSTPDLVELTPHPVFPTGRTEQSTPTRGQQPASRTGGNNEVDIVSGEFSV